MKKILFADVVLPMVQPPILRGGVVIEGSKIVEVGTFDFLKKEHPEAVMEFFEGAALLPSLVNAHAHLEAFTEQTTFEAPHHEEHFIEEWIRQDRHQRLMSFEKKRDAIRAGLAHFLADGVTGIVDVTTCEAALLEYQRAKMRVTMLCELKGLHGELAHDRFQSALALIEDHQHKKNPLIQIGIAADSPFVLSKNLFKILYQYLKSQKIITQIHVSQSFAEMEFFFHSTGKVVSELFPYAGWSQDDLPPIYQQTPVQYLASLDFLKLGPMLVGGSHLAPVDLDLMVQTGSALVFCPSFIRKQGLKVPPLTECLRRQIPIALGSEYPTPQFSMWDEMRLARELAGCSAKTVFEMATSGGGSLLGGSQRVGSLQAGQNADLLAVSLPHSFQEDSIFEGLLENTSKKEVLQVWVGGERVTQ